MYTNKEIVFGVNEPSKAPAPVANTTNALHKNIKNSKKWRKTSMHIDLVLKEGGNFSQQYKNNIISGN